MRSDPLPSWNDGVNKRAILDFVAAVTEEGGAGFVPKGDRIATFDNDGTLWVEHPIYVQALFALDEIKRMAPEHLSGRRNSRLPRSWPMTRRLCVPSPSTISPPAWR